MATTKLTQGESTTVALETPKLYPFELAEMKMTASTLVPPIFKVTVQGETGSLNPVIQLVNTRKIENEFLILEIQGKDGMAIGSTAYTRSINVQQIKKTAGVLVHGANNKSINLPWHAASFDKPAGLFNLPLVSSGMFGAPMVHLNLGVDSINNLVSGISTVTQSLEQPIVCTSHVTGNLIYETVMKPGVSKIRIDLVGYPEIHWPSGAGIGPVWPKNFTAMIIFDSDWTNGRISYQYLSVGGWIKEDQPIQIVR